METELGVDLNRPTILVACHPATIARDTTREADALFSALATLPEQLLFCYPNADAGSRQLMERSQVLCRSTGTREYLSISIPYRYWSLLRCADLLVGNSSSGIMEAASFALPAVNVGIRQRGRERGRNVLDAEATQASILDRLCMARSREFRRSLAGMENPYGDGHASERIAEVLASVPLTEELLIKRATDAFQDHDGRTARTFRHPASLADPDATNLVARTHPGPSAAGSAGESAYQRGSGVAR